MTNTEIKQSERNSYTSPCNFTIIQNDLIRSDHLSCKAFKLLCIGLSHSGSWVFRKEQIAKSFKEGRYTVDAAMKELREIGHLHLIHKKVGTRMQGYYWFWFPDPISGEEFKIFLRNTDFPEFGDFRGAEDTGDIRRQRDKKTNCKKNNNDAGASDVRSSSSSKQKPAAQKPEQKPSPPPPNDSPLDAVPISERTRGRLEALYDEKTLRNAAYAYFEAEEVENPDAWMQSACAGGYEPKKRKQSQQAETNRDWALGLTMEVPQIGAWAIDYKDDCIEATSATYYKCFKFNDKRFKQDFEEFLRKVRRYG